MVKRMDRLMNRWMNTYRKRIGCATTPLRTFVGTGLQMVAMVVVEVVPGNPLSEPPTK